MDHDATPLSPPNETPQGPIVLSVEDLRVSFETHEGTIEAVRGVSFSLRRGKTMALVGESGSGKSVTSYAILRLIQKPGRIVGGKVIFMGKGRPPVDIAALHNRSEELFKIRGGRIGMIFQEPMTALSPVHTIGNQLCEAILLHRDVSPKAATDLAAEMLLRVGITDPKRRLTQYPFEFSGGMRQRVVIAMALVCQPEVLIADEPTTALDVTVQAQILRLINKLQDEMGTTVIFITHDLGVVAQVADDVAVMRNGRIVESGNVRQIFKRPTHPYTRRLLASTPHAAYDPALRALLDATPLPEGLSPAHSFEEPSHPHDAIPDFFNLPEGQQVLVWRPPEGKP